MKPGQRIDPESFVDKADIQYHFNGELHGWTSRRRLTKIGLQKVYDSKTIDMARIYPDEGNKYYELKIE